MGRTTRAGKALMARRPTHSGTGVGVRVVMSRPLALAGVKVTALVALIALAVGFAALRYGASSDHTDTVSAPVTQAPHRDLKVGHGPWSTSVSEAMFHSDRSWSPGETRTAVVEVRNDDSTSQDIELAVDRGSSEDSTAGHLTIAAEVADGPWTDLDLDQDAQQFHIEGLAAHATSVVRLRASVDEQTPGPIEVAAEDLSFTFSVVAPTTGPAGAAATTSSAHLVLAPIFLLVAALGVLVLLVTGRRRRSDDPA